MILPRKVLMEAVRGQTFDGTFTVYASSYAQYLLPEQEVPEEWNPFTQWALSVLVVGSDGKVYLSKKTSKNINPVGDSTGSWEKLTPVNLTGYTAEGKLGTVELTITLGGAEGTVRFEATATQTEGIAPEEVHLWVSLKNPEGKKYEYLSGEVKMSNK